MGLSRSRLEKLETKGRRHGLLRTEDQIARRLAAAKIAVVLWARQSGLLDQAELAALRDAITDPVIPSWALDDPRLPIALGAVHKVPTPHLAAVHEAWQAWYLNVSIPRGAPRRGWIRDCPTCLPLGRLAWATHDALRERPSIVEQAKTLARVREIFGGVPCFVRGSPGVEREGWGNG
jgi:hypothetical protein